MNERAIRGRNRRRFSLEGLEERNLLSVLKPAALAAERVVVPGPTTLVTQVHGFVSGNPAPDPLYSGLPAGFKGYSGHGAARPFGNVIFGMQFLATPNTTPAGSATVSQGSLVMVTNVGGDQLHLSFTGTNQTSNNHLHYWNWTGTVNAGTGRFANASGTFTATGVFPATGAGKFVLDLHITFSPAV